MTSIAPQRAEASRLYGEAVSAFRSAVEGLEKGEASFAPLDASIDALSEGLRRGNQLLVAMTVRSTAGNYLYAHCVNVAILSMNVGRGLGLDPQALHLLGLSALLHDVGMIKYLDLSQAPRPLTKEEHQEIQLHPLESRKLLAHLRDVEETTRRSIGEIIACDHADAAKAASPQNVHRLAQIIALCDMYEAMSHNRSWREAMLPSEAINALLKRHAQQFPRPLVKAFLESMSLYPPGSYVKLSGGEIGRVVGINPKFPTRPTVEVCFRRDLSPMEPALILDLAEKPLSHVNRAVDETKLPIKDARSLLALQAARWWVDAASSSGSR
jgi:HD-GYP domain-containing protein (c-di-GMP phosphodiesterase class II)